jgi:hypothetical protein
MAVCLSTGTASSLATFEFRAALLLLKVHTHSCDNTTVLQLKICDFLGEAGKGFEVL